jgi:GT2 family glycosyltransferase
MILKKLTLQFPETNLILNPSIFVNIQGPKLGLWRCPLPSYPIMISSEQMIGKLLVQNFISIPAPIFKREMALKVGGLDEKLWYTADWDFWLKLAQYGQIIYYPKPLSVFRIHSHSQTVTRSSYIQDFRQQLEFVIDKHLEAWNTSSQTKSKIRKIANFSKEVNIALASIIHGKKLKISFLVQGLFSLGFLDMYKFFRDSRILERIMARMRAKLNQVN